MSTAVQSLQCCPPPLSSSYVLYFTLPLPYLTTVLYARSRVYVLCVCVCVCIVCVCVCMCVCVFCYFLRTQASTRAQAPAGTGAWGRVRACAQALCLHITAPCKWHYLFSKFQFPSHATNAPSGPAKGLFLVFFFLVYTICMAFFHPSGRGKHALSAQQQLQRTEIERLCRLSAIHRSTQPRKKMPNRMQVACERVSCAKETIYM